MRRSCYLNAVEIGDGNSLLYNGLSLCIDAVPSEMANRLLLSREGGDFSFLVPGEREHLVKRGHLTTLTVTEERDEMEKLARAVAKKDVESNGQSFRGKMITFILTYQCNLNCAYCYQSEVRKTAGASSMSEASVDEFFRLYFNKLFPHCDKKEVGFLLYGGEPLLPGNRGAIERILQYAKKHGNAVYTVTNAVMLPRMLDLIGPQKGKINNVQVTLDGGQMFHDEQRVSRSGGPTFEQTIRALRELMKAGANATIRIHLHPQRLESARALVEYLEREKILGQDRVKAYFWSTEDLHSQALSLQEYELFTRLFQEVASKQNYPPTAHFASLRQIMDTETARNLPIRNHCDICVAGLHCVVDSLGDLYECIDDAGHKQRRIGAFAGGELSYFEQNEDNEKLPLCEKPECLKCSVALYCGGGCANRMKAQNDPFSTSFCLQIKEFVALTLKSCFLLKKASAPGAGGREPSRV